MSQKTRMSVEENVLSKRQNARTPERQNATEDASRTKSHKEEQEETSVLSDCKIRECRGGGRAARVGRGLFWVKSHKERQEETSVLSMLAEQASVERGKGREGGEQNSKQGRARQASVGEEEAQGG